MPELAGLTAVGLAGELERLGFDRVDAREVFQLVERVLADPQLATRVSELAADVRGRIGRFLIEPPATARFTEQIHPNSDTSLDQLYLLAYVLTAPDIEAFHVERGIPSGISQETLADLGRQVATHRRTHQELGLESFPWTGAVWTGAIYQLGRLQFEAHRLDPASVLGGFPPAGVQAGDWVIGIHIPETGPLEEAAVAESLAAIRPFLDSHFPEVSADYCRCMSWILDPNLAAALSPSSNLIRFQQLFTPDGQRTAGDEDIVYFVFRRRGLAELDRLPRDSSLRRAVLDRLQRGEHWSLVQGWRRI